MLRRIFAIAFLMGLQAAVIAAGAQTPAPLLPTGIAYDATGNLYFADTARNQVFESTLAGQLLVVAGSGVQGFAGDGGPAVNAALNAPQGVAVGSDGTLYIADTGNQRVRAVVAGQISTIAGTGKAAFGGDGGPAASASFSRPTALALDASGALLVCDSANHRIRRISSSMVTTIAGTGVQGFGGDGGAATSAMLDTPLGLAASADGRIFIADSHNHRVRVIAAVGTITTFAGTGAAGYSGDGGQATAAQLALPQGLSITPTALLIADSNNQRIRSVDAQGVITTLVGTGVQGSSVDAATGQQASLNTPRGVALSAFAAPVFADAGNRLVRELVANHGLYVPAGLNPARMSSVTLTALPGAAYGQPAVTVTVQGSAGTPQGVVRLLDNGAVVGQTALVGGTASFASTALSAGAHSLSASYLGDGVNPAASSTTVSTTIGRAATVTTEQAAQAAYLGLPVVLTATVSSIASGTPTGPVNFSEGATTVATGTLSGGTASGVYLAPTAGTHAIVAQYAGDTNFAPSASSALNVMVGEVPDFTLASVGNATQTAQYGAVATYTLLVAAQPAPFSGAVSLSVSGLPSGVTAAFSPSQVVPGASSAQVTLSLQIPATLVRIEPQPPYWLAMMPVCLVLLRRRRWRSILAGCVALFLLSATGCGDRTLSQASQASRTFALVVSGTGTTLTGAIATHTTPLTLIVQ